MLLKISLKLLESIVGWVGKRYGVKTGTGWENATRWDINENDHYSISSSIDVEYYMQQLHRLGGGEKRTIWSD